MPRSCNYCTGQDPELLPRPYGYGRFVANNPENIRDTEVHDGREWRHCHDCYRRGARWRAKIRQEFSSCTEPKQDDGKKG